MADGTMAVLMLIFGFTDMGNNYCGTDGGCWAVSKEPPRLSVSAGEVVQRHAKAATETYMRYDPGVNYGPFGQAAGVSFGEKGEIWAGYGGTYTIRFGLTGLYAQFHLMPGLYFDNGGFDLGGMFEFRSGIELGYESPKGWRYALAYDHRSNAGIFDQNPGIETVQIKTSSPDRR
jgi:hypothetical protein